MKGILPRQGRSLKPPRGLASVNYAHPFGRRVTACWAFNEGGGGAVTELVSGVQCPIKLNSTEANRIRWRGSSDGLSALDFRQSPTTQNYVRGQRLLRVNYTQGMTFFGVFRYPSGGTSSSNRSLIISRIGAFSGLVWSYSVATPCLTISTSGWAGWNVNTGLVPPRETLIIFIGTQATNGDVRMWMNGQRYSTTGTTYTSRAYDDWAIGSDPYYDTNRQWHGQIYLAGILHGSLTWAEIEAWGRSPFEFLWPSRTKRSLANLQTTFTGTAAFTTRRQTLSGTGTFTKPTYTGSGTLSAKGQTLAGTGTFTKPTYTGTGVLTQAPQVLSGTGTFTKPTYSGTGAFSVRGQVLVGSGAFTQPSYVGTGVLVTKETSLSGVGSFAAETYTGVGSLQTPTTLLSGSGSVTQPSYTGEGVLSIGASYLEASSTFTPLTYSGIAGFISAAMLVAGSGTLTQPTYTGVGNLTSTPQNLTASGTFTKPTYAGTGVLLVSPTITSGAGNVEQPTYTGTADLLSSKTEIDGTAAFAQSVFTGGANFNTASVILSGEGAYTFPVYSGTSAFTVKGVEFVGAAGLVSPIYSGSAVLQSSPATLSGVGAYTAPITVVVITTEAWNVYGVDFDSWINNVDISQISWNIPEFNIGNWKTVNVDLLHWEMKLVSTGKWHIPGE